MADWFIAWHTRPADLPACFSRQETPTGSVAETACPSGSTAVSVSLRFEGELLTSMSVQLSPPQHQGLDDLRFLASTEERVQFHTRWLRRQLNWRAPWPAILPWGEAGVGQDKSGNAFVFLRNTCS